MNKNNTAIFVDYDNVFISLNQYYRDFTKPMLPYTIIEKLHQLYAGDNLVLFNLYADLQNIKVSYSGFNILNACNVSLQHVAQGKNSSDMVLIIEALKSLQQYNFINKLVIVSSDSDMRPLLKEARLANVDIEIIYMEVNTATEYIDILRSNNITVHSIEKLLSLPAVDKNIGYKELFGLMTSNKDYLRMLMIQLNDIIKDLYEKYLREDKYGNVISAGATSLAALSYHIKDRHLVPEYLCARYDDHSMFVQMLVECQVIEPLSYKNKTQDFTTWILSSNFLNCYACPVPHCIDEKCFQPLQI